VTPAALADLVRSAAHDVLTGHGLDPAALPATVTVQRPRDPRHGDYATAVALQAAKQAGVAPREFAGWLALELERRNGVRSAEVAGPGFLNLRLRADAQGEIVAQVLAAEGSFGASQDLAGHRINLELVPANPTAHLGHARRATVGDALGRILAFAGAAVTREYVDAAVGDDAGTVVTMADLVEAVGVDAARYALIRSSYASPIDIDLERWSKRTDDNPVFHVQYAYARLAALTRNAVDLGISSKNAQLSLLDHEREGELIRTLGEFPRIVTRAAQLREPHRVAHYLEELASAYHRFADTCRVLPLGEEQEEQPDPRHAARLALCEATRHVLANGLGLLGVSAPERM
jgi:arginyl-tRNA synthetase